MAKVKQEGVNVTFTLDPDIVEWLDKKVQNSDLNRSQVARRIFREVKDGEKVKRGKK